MSPGHEAAGIESALHTNLNISEVATGSHDKTDGPDPLLIYTATAGEALWLRRGAQPEQPSALAMFLSGTAQAGSKPAVSTDSTNSLPFAQLYQRL